MKHIAIFFVFLIALVTTAISSAATSACNPVDPGAEQLGCTLPQAFLELDKQYKRHQRDQAVESEIWRFESLDSEQIGYMP